MATMLACTNLCKLSNHQLGIETLRERTGRIRQGLSITAESWGQLGSYYYNLVTK